MSIKDLTGEKFGKLTVLKRGENYITKYGKTRARWICKCDCGNEKLINSGSLVNGLTKSCGCLQKEIASKVVSKLNKKYNQYDLSGEYGIGYTSNTNEPFYFDLEDYDKIKDGTWGLHTTKYIAFKPSKSKLILLHRLIMNVPENKCVDHINHNKLDNRKENLRICTQAENSRNSIKSKNNTSGYKGVTYEKDKNKWRARIGINNKTINLGRYNSPELAFEAYTNASKIYHKEFLCVE